MDKRRLIIGGILLGVIVLTVGAGVIYYTVINPAAWARVLNQLDIEPGSVPGSLLASGFIEAEEIEIAAEVGGRVKELPFEEGNEVSGGEVIVRLDTAILEAQIHAAQAQLDIVDAQRELIRAGVREEYIRQAEAQVAAAEAAVDATYAAWQDAIAIRNNPQDIQLQIAEAETQAAVAQEQLTAAQIELQAAARSEELYWQAIDSLAYWTERFDWDRDEVPGLPFGMTMAPNRHQAAQVRMNEAQEALNGATALLNSLWSLANNPMALQAQVIQAETNHNTALASLEQAQAELEDLRAGPTPEQLAVANAQVVEAQAALQALQAQLTRMTLSSPTSGVILEQSIHVGELALPGVPLVTIANLDVVELTVYVAETQFDKVRLDQTVIVTVDTFPDQTFEGTVIHISDEAEFTPRNVQTREERVNLVYAVRIRLPNPDHALKPGMPADALFR